jgi:hypothetical protein
MTTCDNCGRTMESPGLCEACMIVKKEARSRRWKLIASVAGPVVAIAVAILSGGKVKPGRGA